MGIIKSIGSAGTWLDNRAKVGKASGWTTRKTWAIFYGSDGSKIGLESNAVDTQFNTPEPGIDSISVSFKGSLGSLREVTVNYTCWTNDQLEAMSKSYMQLGRSAAVLFGWSVTDEGDRTNVSADGITKGSTFTAFHTDIKKVVKKNRGCVTGYKGLVDNFTFSLNDNGSYTCTCHFITPGEAALDVNMDLSTDGDTVAPSTVDGKPQKQTNLVKQLLATHKDIVSSGQISNPGQSFNVVLERERTDAEKQNESIGGAMARLGGLNSIQNTDTPYISWRYLELTVLNRMIFPLNKNNKGIYEMDSQDTELVKTDSVHSLDPLVAHIPKHSVMDDYKGSLVGLPTIPWNGKLYDIYLNVNFLIEKAMQSKKLQDFLNAVLNGLNAACNNKFSLSCIVDEDDPKKLIVVDANNVETKGISSHTINMFGSNSICRNVTLDTAVPSGMKSEIVYGNNSKADGTSNNESPEFSFTAGTDKLTPDNHELEQPESELKPKPPAPPPPQQVYDDAVADLFGGLDTTGIDGAKGAFNSLPKVTTERKTDKGTNILIPLNLSFDLDGIAGIPYGAMVKGNAVPDVYNAKADFMVKGLSHEVSSDSWTTKIETIMRRKA